MTISTTRVTRLAPALTGVAAALLSCTSWAQEIRNSNAYVAPDNSVALGAGLSSGDQSDRTRFGMFNGLRKHDLNGLLDFNWTEKDLATGSGRWMILEGRNLGLDNRELGFTYRQLGDWKFKADYSEITRHDPRIINTSLTGSGSTNPNISLLPTPGTGQELNLELKRKGIGFELQKAFGDWQVEVMFKNEDKDGARLFGKGLPCSANYVAAGVCSAAASTVLLMIPEPVNSTIRQVEAKLAYNGPQLKMHGGYYGSFYDNSNGSINPTITGATIGNLNGGTIPWDANLRNYMQTPIALWPDNQAHQFYLAGNYAFTRSTKMNFKVSYTHATQNESFTGMGLGGSPTGRSDLGGEINTTRAQLGFQAHPWAPLHLHADLTYEKKDNKTPVALYNSQVASAAPTFNTWTNSAMSPEKSEAKVEANYHLPWYHLQLIGGARIEHEDFGTWTPTDIAGGISGLRQKVDTVGYRIELRKTMSEVFTGSVAWISERRDGASPWLRPLPINGFPALGTTGVVPASQDCPASVVVGGATVQQPGCVYNQNGEFAFTQENMQRDKVRLYGTWNPMDRLSLVGVVDLGTDQFRGPTLQGLRETTMYNISLDADYQLSDIWRLRAYVTSNRRTYDMGRSSDYDLKMTDRSTTVGLGFSGTPFAQLKVGGDLIWMDDRLTYDLTPDANASAANRALLATTGGLPDVKYELTRLNLYGEYNINKTSQVRLDYIYYRSFFNEWTYVNNGIPFLFSDNTTLGADQRQTVNFLGVRYVYKFQ